MSSPYGFWTFDGKNGLKGVASTQEVLHDGRVLTVKDPDNPAILEDVDILHALRTSRVARDHFCMIFPTLLPEEQERLSDLIQSNKRASRLLITSQGFADAVQRDSVSAGVRTRFVRPGSSITPTR